MFAFKKKKKPDNLLGKEWQLFEPHHKTNPEHFLLKRD
jgi:hypothetical protein